MKAFGDLSLSFLLINFVISKEPSTKLKNTDSQGKNGIFHNNDVFLLPLVFTSENIASNFQKLKGEEAARISGRRCREVFLDSISST